MKTIQVLSIFLFFVCPSFAQKQIKDYTKQELQQKKAEALAAKASSDAAVYDAAIMLKEEIDAAVKVEDFDKATALQGQLKALKLSPPASDKAKQLQDEINKAVAAEDFEKAQSLKKELEALKNGPAPVSTPAPAPVQEVKSSGAGLTAKPVSTPPPSQVSNNQSVASASSSLSKNDIYGSSATYMGIDFSLFNLVSPKKLGQEQKLYKYIANWEEAYDKSVGVKKLAHWMGKSELNDESSNVQSLYSQNLNRSWVIADYKTVSRAEIEQQLSTYKSSHQGIALVMIPSPFDEKRHELTLNVVWFDLGSRTIVSMESITVKATGWPAGLTDATKKYIDQYYKKRS